MLVIVRAGAEAAEIVQVAGIALVAYVEGGGVGAGPGDGGVETLVGAAHTGDVAGAHVDLDVGGGADHGVELRVNLNRRAGEGAILAEFGNEDDDLDGGQGVDDPGDLLCEEAFPPSLVSTFLGRSVDEGGIFR